jgi:hypothetical protein
MRVITCTVMNHVGHTIMGRTGCRESIPGSVIRDKIIVHNRMSWRRNLSRTHFFLRKIDIGRFTQTRALEVRFDTVMGTKRRVRLTFQRLVGICDA